MDLWYFRNKELYANLVFLAIIGFFSCKINTQERSEKKNVLVARINDGYLNLGLLGSKEFSLSLSDFSKEDYPDIALFGQGILPHVVSKKLPKHDTKLNQINMALQQEVKKILEDAQKDQNVDSEAHNSIAHSIERKLYSGSFTLLIDVLQQAAIIESIDGHSEKFADLARKLIARCLHSVTQSYQWVLHGTIKKLQDDLDQQKAKNSDEMQKLDHELRIATLKADDSSQVIDSENRRIEWNMQYAQAEKKLLERELALEAKLDQFTRSLTKNRNDMLKRFQVLKNAVASLPRNQADKK